MKVIGYGICGPGEAGRYLKRTLDEFKRLCDTVVILCNNTDKAEHDMIDSYGFKRVSDRREWGKFQWRIKQDFLERDIKQIAEKGDMLVCLDMDEVFSPKLTKEWIKSAPLDAYHVFVVDLWNDEYHFKLESCFWNVRMWRWNGDTKFKAKPVHCGLAPEWTYLYNRHAPFILKHYGLMDEENRKRKIARYERYDPHAEHLDKRYYEMLKDNSAKKFNEDMMQEEVEKEVANYKQTKPNTDIMNKPKLRFAYVKNPHGEVVDIPEKHVAMTLKRKGFEFIGWADEQEEEIEALFQDDELDNSPEEEFVPAHANGSYQRPTTDEEIESQTKFPIDESTTLSKEQFDAIQTEPITDPIESVELSTPIENHPKPNPNKPKEEVKKVDTVKKTKTQTRKKTNKK